MLDEQHVIEILILNIESDYEFFFAYHWFHELWINFCSLFTFLQLSEELSEIRALRYEKPINQINKENWSHKSFLTSTVSIDFDEWCNTMYHG